MLPEKKKIKVRTMKFFRNILFVLAVLSTALLSQSTTVSFIHGFGGSPQVWNTMSTDLSQDYVFNTYNVSYNSAQAIGSSAASVFIPNGSVTVAHSQGGLLAREYLRRVGTHRFDALITVGTPNLGAPVIIGAEGGKMQLLINLWIDDLIEGPSILLGHSSASLYVNGLLEALKIIGNNALQDYIDLLFTAGSITDMKPGSSFLNTLNSAPSNTLPAARYAIFGSETKTLNAHVRLGDSAVRKASSGNPIESGTGVKVHKAVTTVYFASMVAAKSAAFYYFYLYTESSVHDPNRIYYYDRFTYFDAAASGFARGWLSLQKLQHIEWETYMVGSYLGNGALIESDAFIPADFQAPSFFGGINNRRLRAEHANHLELTAHPNARYALAEIFDRPDVLVPKVQAPPPPSPPSVSISGSTGLMQGESSTYSANASGGSTPYSYQWYKRHESTSNWTYISGASGSSYTHTAGAPNGEYLKVVVTDGNSLSANDEHYITILGMGF